MFMCYIWAVLHFNKIDVISNAALRALTPFGVRERLRRCRTSGSVAPLWLCAAFIWQTNQNVYIF